MLLLFLFVALFRGSGFLGMLMLSFLLHCIFTAFENMPLGFACLLSKG